MLDIQATAVQFQAQTRHWYYLHGTQTRSWVHPPSYSTGTNVFALEVKWVRHAANHPSLSCPKVKNEWSYMSVPPICLHGVQFYHHNRLNVLAQFCQGRFSSGYFPSVWILKADVLEHSVSSIFTGRWLWIHNHLPVKMEPKRRLLIFRRWGNTQKKIYLIYNMAKVWKLQQFCHLHSFEYMSY
jgi:hypothetical protein